MQRMLIMLEAYENYMYFKNTTLDSMAFCQPSHFTHTATTASVCDQCFCSVMLTEQTYLNHALYFLLDVLLFICEFLGNKKCNSWKTDHCPKD